MFVGDKLSLPCDDFYKNKKTPDENENYLSRSAEFMLGHPSKLL
jgi:hypothetical protein